MPYRAAQTSANSGRPPRRSRALVHYRDGAAVLERRREFLRREGRKARIFTSPTRFPAARRRSTAAFAVPADEPISTSAHSASSHPAGLDEAVPAPGHPLKLARDIQDDPFGVDHPLRLVALVLHIVGGDVIWTDRHRFRPEQAVLRTVLAGKRPDRVGFNQLDILDRVAGDEAVLADHDRKLHVRDARRSASPGACCRTPPGWSPRRAGASRCPGHPSNRCGRC